MTNLIIKTNRLTEILYFQTGPVENGGLASSSRKQLQQQPQSAAFREGMAESRRVPYINLPTSSYGKIVMKKYVELQESASPVVNCQPIKIPVSTRLF